MKCDICNKDLKKVKVLDIKTTEILVCFELCEEAKELLASLDETPKDDSKDETPKDDSKDETPKDDSNVQVG